ncbi:prenyltransferase [Leptospira biflexa]|uniref:prenyltransferase n=1 Tax=Leptospira biflexa TaxID=172 RepID=UPI0010826ACC|nr:prenyltransferase [Leptospira biflexa]TGM35078.1 prenyltransferase [Leptospira biflexa]TGM38487.1 prenyltransferase [Leptospira biflexa]
MFRKRHIHRTILVLSFVSLDVVLSVFANLSFFSHYFQHSLRTSLLSLYLLSVWALYLLDHLWDAKKETGKKTLRSNFYLQNKVGIASVIGIGIVVVSILGIWYEWKFLFQNLPFLFAFGIGLVLVIQKIAIVPKEILVSFFYTWGILLPFPHWSETDWILFFFFLHVLCNVLLTYQIDRDWDKEQGTFTFNLWVSPRLLTSLVRILLVLGLSSLLWLWRYQNLEIGFILGMGLSYLWLLVTDLFCQNPNTKKITSELAYLPMFVPQIIFFFSALP